MAAGYTLRELMEYMGHSSLQATERYVKLLPPLDETDAVTAVGTVLIHDTNALMHVARLVRPDMAEDEPRSATAQEARNLRRVFALWRCAGEESLTADDLGVSRQQLTQSARRRQARRAAVADAP